ncbi:MAG: prepilin-type N-terminal cleavage/methylation domain-containing protein [Planctomycetota bacterium]|nr:prepilin-type N-terminal cleavage/methylation domain-containing protein [Planctomycetota bacterium]
MRLRNGEGCQLSSAGRHLSSVGGGLSVADSPLSCGGAEQSSGVIRRSRSRTRHFPRAVRQARGLTLVEVMITMVIFVVLAGFTVIAVREVVTQWTQSERRRVLYEKAAGVLDIMADDLRLAVTREPPGVTEVKARFIGDFEPGTKQQRLIFVRAFESGPERAVTFFAGDGARNDLLFKPGAKGEVQPNTALAGGADADEYNGMKVGDYKPLGGMAAVGYFAKNQTLYRAIHAPVPQALSPLLDPGKSQVLATDVLYLGFDYWSQDTQSWEAPTKSTKTTGAEKIWDSTRAIMQPPLDHFSLHRGVDSADDLEDDVFPEKVRITLTVDSPMPRCVFGRLLATIGEGEGGFVDVENTKGFNDGGEPDTFVLIDDEWLHYKKKTVTGFEIDQRGARSTMPKGHAAGAVVRTGKTFRRVVYVPGWREDLTPDDEWRARKEAQKNKPRQVLR